jgi:hypothetical protein
MGIGESMAAEGRHGIEIDGGQNLCSSMEGRLFMSLKEKGLPGMNERVIGNGTTLLSYCKVPSLMSSSRQGELGPCLRPARVANRYTRINTTRFLIGRNARKYKIL